MLPPFIIEQIRQREQRDREQIQPRLELPIERLPPRRPSAEQDDDDPNRGVIILDIG